MANTYFQFKQFTVHHDRCAMKVTTDSCLFGAWAAREVQSLKLQSLTVLDIGTGTGLLSLMLAQKNNIEIDAIEINTEAVQQAVENVAASYWAEQITIIEKDVLQWKTAKEYGIIISNPPFYEGSLKSGIREKDAAHHSTQLTLEQLLEFIKNHLPYDGKFFLLLPFQRLEAFQKVVKKIGLYINQVISVKQTINHAPFRFMVQGSLIRFDKIIEGELSIKDDKQAYTESFISLLKDYYLHL